MSANEPEDFDNTSRDPALKTSLLPQYQSSIATMELFLDAIHKENSAIARAVNMPGIKWADPNEVQADVYSYFYENKADLEREFLIDLVECLGASKAVEFCEIVARDWFAGGAKRRGPRVAGVKSGVRDYISRLLRGTSLDTVVMLSSNPLPPPTFSAEEISKILTVNQRLIYKHLEEWKAQHTGVPPISTDDIFLRRGLSLDTLFAEDFLYREWDFINSYSMAFTATEKFAQMQSAKHPAMVSGDVSLFDGRVLFFSPFMPNMPVAQLEVGVIPALKGLPLRDQGMHGGINEYQLDPRPFDR